MSKAGKPYERPLSPDLAEEILNIPFTVPDEETEPRTVGEYLSRSIRAVEKANEMLAQSNVASLIAKTLMRDLKKRGSPSLFVAPDGQVMLRIAYDEETPEKETVPIVRPTDASDLPKLDELRTMADDLGIDISHLGRQRRTIYNLIMEKKDRLDRGVDEVSVSPAKPKTKLRKASVGKGKGSRKSEPPNGRPEKEAASPPGVLPTESSDMTIDDLLGPGDTA